MWSFERKKLQLPTVATALPGRAKAMEMSGLHSVLHVPLTPPYPAFCEQVLFGMGCFWGVERLFWQQAGVFVTAVGYSGGITPNPTYEEVCSGNTGHNEVVLVVYDPSVIPFGDLLRLFWQNHNPTTGMQQANDIGTQYRSGIYTFQADQLEAALASREQYQLQLGVDKLITTEITAAGPFYFAEPYHQQYLVKNPGGYCNLQSFSKTGLPSY